MKKTLLACAALYLAAAPAGERGIFGLYGDTPDAKHAWAIHDFNRPYPKQVETPEGKPPSDAIVLSSSSTARSGAWTRTGATRRDSPRSGA